MGDYELFEGCWRPVRQRETEPEVIMADGQRKLLVSYSWNEEEPQRVYDDMEYWYNAALWPTVEELEAYLAIEPDTFIAV